MNKFFAITLLVAALALAACATPPAAQPTSAPPFLLAARRIPL